MRYSVIIPVYNRPDEVGLKQGPQKTKAEFS